MSGVLKFTHLHPWQTAYLPLFSGSEFSSLLQLSAIRSVTWRTYPCDTPPSSSSAPADIANVHDRARPFVPVFSKLMGATSPALPLQATPRTLGEWHHGSQRIGGRSRADAKRQPCARRAAPRIAACSGLSKCWLWISNSLSPLRWIPPAASPKRNRFAPPQRPEAAWRSPAAQSDLHAR
jgi:hypothetical protein